MSHAVSSRIIAALLFASPWLCQAAGTTVGGSPHFTAARAEIELVESEPFSVQTVIDTQTAGESFAVADAIPGAMAKVRSQFGVNGAYASISPGSTRYAAFAESIWSDGFTVSGAPGMSSLEIHVSVNGMLEGPIAAEGPGANAFYRLFVSDQPITCNFDAYTCDGVEAVPFTVEINGQRDFHVTVPVAIGKTLYIASYLGAEVWRGAAGEADFYHSAEFTIQSSPGTSLASASGTIYPVPEPSQMMMFLAGGLLVLGARLATRR